MTRSILICFFETEPKRGRSARPNRRQLGGWDRASIRVVSFSRLGSGSAALIFHWRMDHYLGPIPIGPCPVAVFSSLAFAASVVVWAVCRRGKKPNRC